MKLPYPERSSFLIPCGEAIRSNKDNLLNGAVISVRLSKQGYNRECLITISPNDPYHFQTDWESNYPSRLSSRIRAAALALYKEGCFGTFKVSHQSGLLTIQLANAKRLLFKKVTKSLFTDGVRINRAFHDLFNPPDSDTFVDKGTSKPITVQCNEMEFAARYLHENPTQVEREMQSIRFSKELKDKFKSVFPNQVGYFSIELGESLEEFVFKVVEDTSPTATESFAKQYIKQEHLNINEAAVTKQRRERLKRYSKNKVSTKKAINNRLVNQSDAILKEDIKQLYHYHCQICLVQIKKAAWTEGLNTLHETEYLSADAHHVTPLENGGFDTPCNIICVCPNCHRRLHTGELLIEFTPDGPKCNNQLTGKEVQMVIDPDHTFGQRTL